MKHLAYRDTVGTSTGVSQFRMLAGREVRVAFDSLLRNKEVKTDIAPEYSLHLIADIIKTFNIAQQHLQMSYSRQKKCDDRHRGKNAYSEGDLAQITD